MHLVCTLLTEGVHFGPFRSANRTVAIPEKKSAEISKKDLRAVSGLCQYVYPSGLPPEYCGEMPPEQ